MAQPQRGMPQSVPRLRRSDPGQPGFRRVRRGRGFVYLDERDARIDDPETLARIEGLAIPPAWADVWICPWPHGHLQALGTDAAGRRQYLYHPAWRARRDGEKFERMLTFARALPAARRLARGHLRKRGMPRERALASALLLLDSGFFRVGGEAYAESNGTFGLATMRKEQVSVRGKEIVFEYLAKGGKERIQTVVDPALARAVGSLKRQRSIGPELLAYEVEGEWRDVKSADVNDYVKEALGGDYTAKDFRTWHATVLAAVALATAPKGKATPTSLKRVAAQTCKEVAEYLGNTPAVCRKSYIDPRLFDRHTEGATIDPSLLEGGLDELRTREQIEEAVIELLTEEQNLQKSA